MKFKLYLALSIIYAFDTKGTTLENVRRDILALLDKGETTLQNENIKIDLIQINPANDIKYKDDNVLPSKNGKRRDIFSPSIKDIQKSQDKARIINKARNKHDQGDRNPALLGSVDWNKSFIKDPILNNLRRSMNNRRKANYGIPKIPRPTFNFTDSESSERDVADWKEEWEKLWKKKNEAHDAKEPQGDVVNIVGARPWGIPCGDPDQHDMPWGTCVLSMECEAEHRIYRGDTRCGRTEFVCCAYLLTTYDEVQANDYMSIEDKGISADSQEQVRNALKYKEAKMKRRLKNRKKRILERYSRKKKMRTTIVSIIKEISKMLTKMYANSTNTAQQKTKQIQKFIKKMKKRFKKERKALKDVHNEAMVNIDSKLHKKLIELRKLNANFVKNDTFRDILVNGTISPRGARMLVQAYPEMYKFIPRLLRTSDMLRPRIQGRRSGSLLPKELPDDNLEYDIEFGYLYY